MAGKNVRKVWCLRGHGLGAAKGEGGVMQTVCCVCQKTKSQVGWIQGQLSRESMVSHGYCPECFHQTMERAQNWLLARNGGNRAAALGR